jgi:hypothetical protein
LANPCRRSLSLLERQLANPCRTADGYRFDRSHQYAKTCEPRGMCHLQSLTISCSGCHHRDLLLFQQGLEHLLRSPGFMGGPLTQVNSLTHLVLLATDAHHDARCVEKVAFKCGWEDKNYEHIILELAMTTVTNFQPGTWSRIN